MRQVAIFPVLCHTGSVSRASAVPKQDLLADLSGLEQIHELKRTQAAKTLEQLETAKYRAFHRLYTIEDLFKYLTWKQEETINRRFIAGSLPLEELRTRIGMGRAALPVPGKSGFALPAMAPAETAAALRPVQAVRRINALRKNIVQFGLVRDRAGELAEAATAHAAETKAAGAKTHAGKSGGGSCPVIIAGTEAAKKAAKKLGVELRELPV